MDYVLRYGAENTTNRTDYDTLPNIRKIFNKLKKDSSVIWAEILYEPLENEDVQELIDEFEKPVINFFGHNVVVNIGDD